MDNKAKFSVNKDVLNGVDVNVLDSGKWTRFHSSHAVWQLARMGAYNTDGALPDLIRLEGIDEILERYPDKERFVVMMDITDNETELSDTSILFDVLLRFAVRKAKSRKPDSLSLHIISSTKAVKSSDTKLSNWKDVSGIQEKLLVQLSELVITKDVLPSDIAVDELTKRVIDATTLEYRRRRQGRHGDETLWGCELEALKVLQDAGIAGSDLAPALRSLIAVVSDQNVTDTPIQHSVFDRKAAYLIIRDFQRRANISLPCVRVIDERFIADGDSCSEVLSRTPSWPQVIRTDGSHLILRDDFDSAMKWARRATAVSGRGLLPVFLFTGEDGSGRSVMLKQVAWGLYRQGFAVAEILDIEAAAVEAEHLANGAVAGDSPLVLIWDDPLGLGQNPVEPIKEIASAQISGAPIVILSTATSKDIFPKFFSRTIIEEFELHPFQPGEKQKLIQSKSVDDGTEYTGDVDNDDMPALNTWLKIIRKTDLNEFTREIWAQIRKRDTDVVTISRMTASLNVLGLTAPLKMFEDMFPSMDWTTVKSVKGDNGDAIFRWISSLNGDNTELLDIGHPILAGAIWSHMDVPEKDLEGYFEKIIRACINTPMLQPWLIHVFHAVNFANRKPFNLGPHISEFLRVELDDRHRDVSTCVLSRLFYLVKECGDEHLLQLLVDILADRVREAGTDAFTALSPLLRNRQGGLTDEEALKALNAAVPSIDRIGYKFLIKFLGDHIPGENGRKAVEDARTSAARDPDFGYAMAAYLRLVWHRGSEDQLKRAVSETESWLEANPQDRVVRRVFVDFVLKKGDQTLKLQICDALENWLMEHFDEGPLRKAYLDLVISLEDSPRIDRALDQTADWIEKRGNNRAVRNLYFRQAEQRKDKSIMSRACEAAITWLNNYPDDRDTLRSLMFLSGRVRKKAYAVPALNLVTQWFVTHRVERDMLKVYINLADRNGGGADMAGIYNIIEMYLDSNPEDNEIREMLLGFASRRFDRKLQVKVYNKYSLWLEGQKTELPMLEYLVGRLGVRAGVARRAIPLLERASAREDSDLREHAGLWLGSAYRVAGEYLDARKIWQSVLKSEDDGMREKAGRNLEILEAFLNEKFPDGYPPKPVEPPKPPRRQASKPERFRRPDPGKKLEEKPGLDRKQSARPDDRPSRPKRPRTDKPKGPRGKLDRQAQSKPGSKTDTVRQGATLGDLLRLQGLDLKGELSKSKKKK